MRGFGQIDELARIAEPDVGVITNIGPVHLELVGSLEGVARAKAELLAHVPVAVVPADEPLLEPYLRDGPRRRALRHRRACSRTSIRRAVTILARELRVELEVPFTARHQLVNLLAAVAAAQAVGVEPSGRVDVSFGALRGEHVELPIGRRRHQRLLQRQPAVHARRARRSRHAGARRGGVSPCSETCSSSARARREAHREIGAYAAASGVDVLVAVGPLVGGRCPRRSAARRTWRPTRGEAAALVARARAARRRRAGEGVARDRPGDGRGGAGPWVRS